MLCFQNCDQFTLPTDKQAENEATMPQHSTATGNIPTPPSAPCKLPSMLLYSLCTQPALTRTCYMKRQLMLPQRPAVWEQAVRSLGHAARIKSAPVPALGNQQEAAPQVSQFCPCAALSLLCRPCVTVCTGLCSQGLLWA